MKSSGNKEFSLKSAAKTSHDSIDQLDSNLKLINSRLKFLIGNDRAKFTQFDHQLEQINEKLGKIDEVIYDSKSTFREHSRRRPTSNTIFILFAIFVILSTCFFYGQLKIYIIYFLRLMVIGVRSLILINFFFHKFIESVGF